MQQSSAKEVDGNYLNSLAGLLHTLFTANLAILELYLDLLKNRNKITFKYVQKIYRVLTETKAHQVIYKSTQLRLQKHRFSDEKTLRQVCFRLIEKILSKLNYYFLNERSLAIVACYALKLIRFNSLALAKCRTLKNSFIELVFEVLDEIILENELLEQNIYLLLVDRGYVASIDEFYQINGFEAPPVDCLANIKERKEQQIIPQSLGSGQANKQLIESQNVNKSECSLESYKSADSTDKVRKQLDRQQKHSPYQLTKLQRAKQAENNNINRVNNLIHLNLSKMLQAAHENASLLQNIEAELMHSDKTVQAAQRIFGSSKRTSGNSERTLSLSRKTSQFMAMVKNLSLDKYTPNQKPAGETQLDSHSPRIFQERRISINKKNRLVAKQLPHRLAQRLITTESDSSFIDTVAKNVLQKYTQKIRRKQSTDSSVKNFQRGSVPVFQVKKCAFVPQKFDMDSLFQMKILTQLDSVVQQAGNGSVNKYLRRPSPREFDSQMYEAQYAKYIDSYLQHRKGGNNRQKQKLTVYNIDKDKWAQFRQGGVLTKKGRNIEQAKHYASETRQVQIYDRVKRRLLV